MGSFNNCLILPTFVAPPLYYYHLIKQVDTIVYDLNETYVKQSLRNRYYILSPNGIQRLVIPVIKPNGHHTKTISIRVDYSKSWVQQHLRSMQTAYGKAPFFLFVWDEIRHCFENKKNFLWEFNYEFNQLIFKWLGLHPKIQFADEFIPINEKNDNDLRPAFKKHQLKGMKKPYYQPFYEKFGFIDGLSVLDTIFCLGLETRCLL
ncbi:MAG: WbqC family protein [Bacteroidales bacterium]|nr:WbqC family protein [Bacteroidales bacterium]